MKKLKKDKRKGRRRSSKQVEPTNATAAGSSSQLATDDERIDSDETADDDAGKSVATEKNVESLEKQCWTKPSDAEEKSREEEFDEYLEDLLL